MKGKLELKSSHEVVYTVYEADVERIFYCKPTGTDLITVLMKDGNRLYCNEVYPLQEEPISEDLEKAAIESFKKIVDSGKNSFLEIFKAGAQWQKEQDKETIEMEKMKEQMMEKAIGWIGEINNHHHIMRYSDSCEPSLKELTEWFKNYMKEGGKDE